MKKNDPKYTASTVNIVAVENGYILTLQTFSAQLGLVATSMDELVGILRDTDLRVFTRPFGNDSLGKIPRDFASESTGVAQGSPR